MKKTLLFILCAIAISSCRDKNNSQVPYVPVNLVINTSQPDFFNLTVPTGWVYVTGGSRGIIIYRISDTEFIALERHSSYNVSDQCAVNVLSDGVLLDDPCSDSEWLITNGSVVTGPASMPLLIYDTSFNSPFLTITN